MNNKIEALLSITIIFLIIFISFSNTYDKDPAQICSTSICFSQLAIENKDINFCLKNESFANSCIQNFAIETRTPQNCELTSDSQSCYLNIALKTQDISLCDNTENSNQCILSISVILENPNLCFSSKEHLSCIFSYAYFSNNPDICNLLKNESEKNRCFTDIRNR